GALLSAEARLRAKADATKQSSLPLWNQSWIASLALAMTAHGRGADFRTHNAPQRHFSRLPKSRDRRTIRLPTQSWAELQPRRRRWDKTSEVPAVPGALHWWAHSKAVKPHFSKPYWRAPAPSPAPAASMPEPPPAIPVPRPATTRWASALPPPPPPSWATATPSSIVPVRSN